MIEFLSFVDLIVPPILLIIIYLVSKSRQLKHIESNPSYKYYLWGLGMKIIGGVSVCLIYILYYGYGDTLNYYNDCVVMVNMFLKSPALLLQIVTGSNPEVWYEFQKRKN